MFFTFPFPFSWNVEIVATHSSFNWADDDSALKMGKWQLGRNWNSWMVVLNEDATSVLLHKKDKLYSYGSCIFRSLYFSRLTSPELIHHRSTFISKYNHGSHHKMNNPALCFDQGCMKCLVTNLWLQNSCKVQLKVNGPIFGHIISEHLTWENMIIKIFKIKFLLIQIFKGTK